MSRWFDKYLKTYITNPGQNDARIPYGVEILHVAPQGEWYQIIGVHHLDSSENHSQHNVFCEVLDEQGNRIKNAILTVSNVNNTVNHVAADKPDNEPGASIPMWGNDTLTIWVTGLTPSEKVTGLHTRHADEGSGNTLGHHSYLVVWQKKRVGPQPEPEPEPEPEPPPPVDWRKQFTAGELWLIEQSNLWSNSPLMVIVNKMARILDGRR